jgi:hypothetical protein
MLDFDDADDSSAVLGDENRSVDLGEVPSPVTASAELDLRLEFVIGKQVSVAGAPRIQVGAGNL